MPETQRSEVIHVRLPKDMVKSIDHLAVDAELYRTGAIERLLAFALAHVGPSGRIPEVGVA